MSIAGVPLSLWRQLAQVADVTFTGAGGQAPVITARANAPTTNINPFNVGGDDFVLSNAFGFPQASLRPNALGDPFFGSSGSSGPFSLLNGGPQDLGGGAIPGAGNRLLSTSGQGGAGASNGPPGLARTNGVPPGLVNKGGMPPGQAKKMNAGGKPKGGQVGLQ